MVPDISYASSIGETRGGRCQEEEAVGEARGDQDEEEERVGLEGRDHGEAGGQEGPVLAPMNICRRICDG